jgi:hypothetical protein
MTKTPETSPEVGAAQAPATRRAAEACVQPVFVQPDGERGEVQPTGRLRAWLSICA